MTKTYCDICGCEGHVLKFSYPCHLDPSGQWNGYVDGDFNPTSGRDESKDCCRKCHNLIFSAAITKMVQLQKEYVVNQPSLPEDDYKFDDRNYK